MRYLVVLFAAGLLFGCGGKGASNSAGQKETGPKAFAVKVGETERSFEIKDSVILNSSNEGLEDARKGQKQVEHTIVLASFGFEGQPMRSTPTGQIRVSFKVRGDWIAANDPIIFKPGRYSAGSNGPMSVSDFNVILNESGKEVQNYKTYGFTGSVNITSVEGNTVSGEVDLSVAGGQSIKGSFTAKQEGK